MSKYNEYLIEDLSYSTFNIKNIDFLYKIRRIKNEV